jgi:dihydropyrimidine dehydrogenase (NADP+)
MSIGRMMRKEGYADSGASLSGIGGVETGGDAAEFLLLGSDTVQVCTGVMVHGYGMVKNLAGGLQAFMKQHGFTSVSEFRGAALPYFTTHADLVVRQRSALEQRKAARVGLDNDTAWTGDGFVAEADSMVSNR